MDITYGMGLLILLAIAGPILVISQESKKKRMMFAWIVGALILASALQVFGVIQIPQLNGIIPINQGQALSGTGIGIQTQAGACGEGFIKIDGVCKCIGVSSGTTVTLSGQDKYTSTASGGTHRYRINGAPAKTVSDAGTLTASPGDVLSILWGNGSVTSYFNKVDTVTVPCASTKTIYTQTANNGTLTISMYNRDGDVISSSVAETMSAGDVQALKIKLQGAFQKDFPYGFIAVVEYNSSEMDSVKMLSQGGIELPIATIPTANVPGDGINSVRKAYLVPEAIGSAENYYQLNLDADDTINPASANGNVTLTYYPRNYFINEDNGGAFDGPTAEDEDSSVTRTGQFVYGVYIA